MSEKEYLLSKISQVAGQINRHKNQQENPAPPAQPPPAPQPYHHNSHHRYSAYAYPSTRGSPYAPLRGRGRGRGGRIAHVHRNRSLVLNSGTGSNGVTAPKTEGEDGQNTPVLSSPPIAAGTSTGAPGSLPSPGTGQQWVAKRDRHMQLINSAVYDQQAVARAKAMEATRQEKLKRRSDRQKLKLKRFLATTQHGGIAPYGSPYGSSAIPRNHEVVIGASKYSISPGGNKLVKVSDDIQTTDSTPKKAVVGGVTFIRSKSGNLWRSGLVKTTRASTRKISKPCKYFTMTGKCQRGMSCPYTHDPNRVAICPRFLQSDNCPEGDACDLSHDPTPHRVPACLHFLRGNCSNSNCRYAHIRVNPAAPICRAFATEGYCEKGGDCTERHVHECPDYDEKGMCNDSKCKLPHIERAGRRRMAAAAAAAASSSSGTGKTTNNDSGVPEVEEESDISSDEDGEAIDSDDVDSDALSDDEDEEGDEEGQLIKSDGPKNNSQEVKQQLDFIRL